MDDKRLMLRHLLASLAYRTQKALREAPPEFAHFSAGNQVRSPIDLLRHMTGVLGDARAKYRGGTYRPEPLEDFSQEIERFHTMLEDLSDHLLRGEPLVDSTPERLLQGPLSDAMTHVGQLAMLRPLALMDSLRGVGVVARSLALISTPVFLLSCAGGEADTGLGPATSLTISLSPTTVTVGVGESFAITPTVRDGTGRVVSGRPTAWTSSDASVATVGDSGTVHGQAPGQTTITATVTVNGTPSSATATVTVVQGATSE